MKNGETKNTTNTEPTKNGIDEQTDSTGTRSEAENHSVLGNETETGRVQYTESEQGGQTEDEANGGRGLVWDFSKIWNNNFLAEQETVPPIRDFLRGSDLGKPMIDVYLKMKGEPYTNPPNDRSLRKFEAGNFWEFLVKLVLMRAGIYIDTQQETSFQYDGLLRVSGHPDFIAGGKPDWDKAKDNLKDLPLPSAFMRTYEKIVEYLSENYPDGLEELVLEIKSTSGDFFNTLERSGRALKIHRLQLFNYLKSLKKERGAIIYISRDDMRILTIPVFNPSPVEDEYREYIEKISGYVSRQELPPLEQPIVWDEDMQRVKKNSMIGWSPYLTKLYGFKDQKEFDDKYTPIQAKFTRVLTRIAKGDKMTDKNLEAIKEMQAMGFDPYEVAEYYKKPVTSDEELPTNNNNND